MGTIDTKTPDTGLQRKRGVASANDFHSEPGEELESRLPLNASTKRICFVLQVKPDRLEEYKYRHRAVWPEMLAALRESGWNNYSLFLRADGLLIGYLETEDFEQARAEMAKREVNQRWQHQMADFFVQPEGLLPDQAMVSLEEVFHL
jgi:L-rhamnose mutarotase